MPKTPTIPAAKHILRFFTFGEHATEIGILRDRTAWDMMLYFLCPHKNQMEFLLATTDDETPDTNGGVLYRSERKLGYSVGKSPYIAFKWEASSSLWTTDMAINVDRWLYAGMTEAEFRVHLQHHLECPHSKLDEIISCACPERVPVCGCGEFALTGGKPCDNCGAPLCASCLGSANCDGCFQLLADDLMPEREDSALAKR